MTAILLSLVLAHTSRATFLVTCTVIRRFTFRGTTIAYTSDNQLEPLVIDGTINF